MDLLCFCSVFSLLCLCARLFICALWSPAGKGLTSWLSFVVSAVSLSLSHLYPGSGVLSLNNIANANWCHSTFAVSESLETHFINKLLQKPVNLFNKIAELNSIISLPHQDDCKFRMDIKLSTTQHRTITDSHNGSNNKQQTNTNKTTVLERTAA